MQDKKGLATIEVNRRSWQQSLLISALAFAASLPYLAYALSPARPLPSLLQQRAAIGGEGIHPLILSQLGLLALLFLLCSAIFCLFGRRYGLPPLGWPQAGDFSPFWQWFLLGPAVAAAFHCVSYWAVDRFGFPALRELYPEEIAGAGAKMLMNAAALTVVGRLGLLTVARGITRRSTLANLLVSLFFVFLLFHTLHRYGALNWQSPTLPLAAALVGGSQFLINGVYLRRGLWPALYLQLLLEAKYPLYAGLAF